MLQTTVYCVANNCLLSEWQHICFHLSLKSPEHYRWMAVGAHTLLLCTVQYIVTALSRHCSLNTVTIYPMKKTEWLKLMPQHDIQNNSSLLLLCSFPRKLCNDHTTKRKLILMTQVFITVPQGTPSTDLLFARARRPASVSGSRRGWLVARVKPKLTGRYGRVSARHRTNKGGG